jgi:hypothetical protein
MADIGAARDTCAQMIQHRLNDLFTILWSFEVKIIAISVNIMT